MKTITVSMDLTEYENETREQFEIGQTLAYSEIRKALSMDEPSFRIKLAEIIDEFGSQNQKYFLFKDLYTLCGHGTYSLHSQVEDVTNG